MWTDASVSGATSIKERYGKAATPSDPQIKPTKAVVLPDLISSSRCSSGEKVNPQGLRGRVLYFNKTENLPFNTKNGCSYWMLVTLPDFAIR